MFYYEPLKMIVKPVVLVGLALLAMAGCEDSKSDKEAKEKEVAVYELEQKLEAEQRKRKYFTDWGLVGDMVGKTTTYPVDLDGDGDMDLVGSDEWGAIRIWENQMPQKTNKK